MPVSVVVPMSDEDFREQVIILGRLAGQDIDDLMACTVDELTQMAQAYRDAADPAEVTAWDNFIKVLGMCAQVAGPLATIASAVTGVFSIATAAKGL